ncbi:MULTISPECIES: ectoine synthase [Pseudomonas]|uniref:L-ectoine synthase n=1 Tax=Pseudomonas gessardii TaxID=78544 RepID=A0A7Y1MWE6_9PSED|nr:MULTISPECIES: ectoine synthase [Pseudomonas]MBH3425210.1 ectoine synthase [Pseudomonas gessardii]MCF4981852.1 cupin domain-containing protein [Pseudomonas gessardii]MCF4992117.1 cupin domain-containing protein [Pseudomonas gessardii]MCF5087627.1 cupin domain-containing protein [Pseudomonas gessardii]MCF5097624.1 cupin domain-containing protein [Pseudomonas gessardii]
MFIRNKSEIENTGHFVEWGAGTSHRLLTEKDGMGYTICHTVVRAGTESLLHYRNHLEACYCIAGEGEVEDMDGNIYQIRPGDIYVLDQHDRHYLRGGRHEDLVLVSVFNPPLKGDERHNLSDTSGSSY